MKINSVLFQKSILCYCWIFIIATFCYEPVTSQVQLQNYLPDSVKQKLAVLPESLHDSIYSDIGEAYYGQFNDEGYIKALDCYNKMLELALKYNNQMRIREAYYYIGTVYDAVKTEPQKILYYYKKSYELGIEQKADPLIIFRLTYNVAHAYRELGDSANSMLYLGQFEQGKQAYKESNPLMYDKFSLLVAYMTLQNNDIKDFIQKYENLNKQQEYKDGSYPYGRYFALCGWRYAYEKKNYKKAIESIEFELKNQTTDSSLLMPFLANAYAEIGDNKAAFKWAMALNAYNSEHSKESIKKDLYVKLLKTNNDLQERDNKILSKQRAYFFLALMLSLFVSFIIAYFWWSNQQKKLQLLKSNAERDVLMQELQHRVKNNLQLLYGLSKLQLRGLKDEAAKELWQKNLNQIKSMSLINEKLYQSDITTISVRDFVSDILNHSLLIYDLQKKITLHTDIEHPLSIDGSFATSFGLILSELVTNSFKHALNKQDKGDIRITIKKLNAKTLMFTYEDSGVENKEQSASKNTNGINLIDDLTRQLKGKMMPNEGEKPYKYSFELPLGN